MRAETTERLCCPLCHGPFHWSDIVPLGSQIHRAVVRCPSCRTRSDVREGIGYFLPGDSDLARVSARPTEPRLEPVERLPDAVGSAAPWADAFQATLDRARSRLDEASAPTLQIAGDRTASLVPSRGGFLLAGDPEELRPPNVPRREVTSWDEFVVELHSLPFVRGAAGNAFGGPSLQEAAGLRIVLQELHRVVRGRFVGVVAFANPEAPGADIPTNFTESGFLDAFRRARWPAEFELVAEAELPGPNGGTGSAGPPTHWRWGLVTADPSKA